MPPLVYAVAAACMCGDGGQNGEWRSVAYARPVDVSAVLGCDSAKAYHGKSAWYSTTLNERRRVGLLHRPAEYGIHQATNR